MAFVIPLSNLNKLHLHLPPAKKEKQLKQKGWGHGSSARPWVQTPVLPREN
jgi:hypothetical protein